MICTARWASPLIHDEKSLRGIRCASCTDPPPPPPPFQCGVLTRCERHRSENLEASHVAPHQSLTSTMHVGERVDASASESDKSTSLSLILQFVCMQRGRKLALHTLHGNNWRIKGTFPHGFEV